MVLEKSRKSVRKKLTPVAKYVSKWLTPNEVTLIAFFMAIISAALFFKNLLLLGTLFAIISSILDVLDGIIAREKNLETKKGDFFDHTIDRFSDTIILMGLTFSSYVSQEIGLIALIGVLLTGYIGTQAEAVINERIYKGITSRADIIFLISIFSILTILFQEKIYNKHLIEWAIVLLAISSNLTALQRISITWKRLN